MDTRRVKNSIYKLVTRAYGIFNPIEKKVVFSSFGGKQYSDNPRAISEMLHEMYPDFKIVWWLKDTNDKYGLIPEYVDKVIVNRMNIIKERATAFCVVTNEDIKGDVYKRKGQFYIQTWHGDLGFKKVLFDIPSDKLPSNYKVYDEEVTDLCIAASDYGIKQYRSAFRYTGEILKVGMPRNDQLVNSDKDKEKETKARLGIPENANILIYAPTFRDNLNSKQKATIDLEKVINILNKKGEKWICLIRSHSSSLGISFDHGTESFFDVSDYPDMADLLGISDLLITDYSSCAGDFIRKRRGAILAVFDKDEYTKNCRELPFDFKEAGFITAETQEELDYIVENYSLHDYENNADAIMRYFNITETGKSAQEICKRIKCEYDSK